MNLATTWGSFRQYRTSSRDRGSGKGNRLIRSIDDIAKSLSDSFGVRRRQQRRGIDPAGKQRAQSLGVSPGLDKKDVLFRIHPGAAESLYAEIMGILPILCGFLPFKSWILVISGLARML